MTLSMSLAMGPTVLLFPQLSLHGGNGHKRARTSAMTSRTLTVLLLCAIDAREPPYSSHHEAPSPPFGPLLRRGRTRRDGDLQQPGRVPLVHPLHPGQRRTLRRGGPPPEARLHAQQLPARLGRPPRRGDGLLPCLHHGREHQRRALHAVRRPRQGQHGMLMRRPGTSSPKAPAPSAP